MAETESARGAGWTGKVTIFAGEFNSSPNFSNSVDETTTWTFTGGATVQKDAQGRAVQWKQIVSYHSIIGGLGTRSDICGGRYEEEYFGISGGYDSGRAQIIFGFPSPTSAPMPLPIEVQVTDPDPFKLKTTFKCPGDPTYVTSSLRDPCRVTLGEGQPIPRFAQRYQTKTISYSYDEIDPGGFLCISSYDHAAVNVQLTRLPDNDCDGVPNGRDPMRGECPLPPICKDEERPVLRAVPRHTAGASGSDRRRLFPKHPVLKVDVKCPECNSVTASAPVRSNGKLIGRLHARRTRVVRGRATLRFKVPWRLYSKIAGALLDRRGVYADLKVKGRDGSGDRASFRKARARFLGVKLKNGSPRARGSAQQSATQCTSLVRYVSVSVPDAIGGVKG